jgi:hypothetical protein
MSQAAVPKTLIPAKEQVWCPGGRWWSDGFAIALTSIFFAIDLTLVLRHAMWRDEWAVMQVAHRVSFGTVTGLVAHSGVPFTWYWFAWLFDALRLDPWGLLVCHALISGACVFVVAHFAPFSRPQKVLFAFGYFPLFEWGMIVRDYAIGMLAALVACLLFTQVRRRPIAFALAIAALGQTTAFGAPIGGALLAAYLVDLWQDRRPQRGRVSVGRMLACAAILLTSVGLTYWFCRLIPGSWHKQYPLGRAGDYALWFAQGIGNIWRGDCPIPFRGQWNSNMMDAWPWVEFCLGLGAMVVVSLLLLRSPAAVTFYLLATLGVAMINMMNVCVVRHCGHYFLVLLMAYWIYLRSAHPPFLPPAAATVLERLGRVLPAGFISVLAVQCFVAAEMVTEAQAVSFSGSRDAADLIRRRAPSDDPIIGDVDFSVAPVSAYLNRPIYVPYRNAYCTYLIEDEKERFVPVPPQDLRRAIDSVISATGHDVVLLLNYAPQIAGDRVELLGVVNQTMVPDEQYMIYLVRRR